MIDFVQNSNYFGIALCFVLYLFGMFLKNKTNWIICNPLLIATISGIIILSVSKIPYESFYQSAKMISLLTTPATVCLAIPLYKQLGILKKNKIAILIGIFSGVLTSALVILLLSMLFGLSHVQYVTLLPKSITTAIGIGVCEELGGVSSITILCIMVTGIFGAVFADVIFKLGKIQNPISRGLALGCASHSMGTAKAMELGEVETAMSSLSIVVAGLMTVIVVPIIAMYY